MIPNCCSNDMNILVSVHHCCHFCSVYMNPRPSTPALASKCLAKQQRFVEISHTLFRYVILARYSAICSINLHAITRRYQECVQWGLWYAESECDASFGRTPRNGNVQYSLPILRYRNLVALRSGTRTRHEIYSSSSQYLDRYVKTWAQCIYTQR